MIKQNISGIPINFSSLYLSRSQKCIQGIFDGFWMESQIFGQCI